MWGKLDSKLPKVRVVEDLVVRDYVCVWSCRIVGKMEKNPWRDTEI